MAAGAQWAGAERSLKNPMATVENALSDAVNKLRQSLRAQSYDILTLAVSPECLADDRRRGLEKALAHLFYMELCMERCADGDVEVPRQMQRFLDL